MKSTRDKLTEKAKSIDRGNLRGCIRRELIASLAVKALASVR
jgi:hypothetical protein